MIATINIKKYAIQGIPLVLLAWFGGKLSEAYRMAAGTGLSEKLPGMLSGIAGIGANPAPSLNPMDLLVGIALAAALQTYLYIKKKNAKTYRHNEEYGSARWGTPDDIAPFMDRKDKANNIILSQTEGLRMNGKPPKPMYGRNKNVLICGGSGSGKTRFHLKPNLMNLYGSYVISDPKGTVLLECGNLLRRNKYRLRFLNTVNFSKSMHYNPFAYIHSEKDVLQLVNCLVANTKGEGDKSGEDFWVKAEKMLLTALIAYIHYEAPEEERNFAMLLEMVDSMEIREDDETFKNAVDFMFEALAERDPGHFAVRQYAKYRLAAGKTAKSILISCGARLAPFDIAEVREITAYDELELDTIGDEKTALFLVMSDSDKTFDFLIALAVSQMFNQLLTKADDVYGGALPVPVQCLLDEVANITIPGLERIIAVCRSRLVGIAMYVQAQSQLKAIYRDNADTIVGCADSFVFLGGKEKSTLKEVSELLGKQTVAMQNTSENRGREKTFGTSNQSLARDLMSMDELAVMPGDECIVQIRGVRPFQSKKYDITAHPNYKYLSDYDAKNTFDIGAFLECRMTLKGNMQVVTYELNPVAS